MFKKVNNKILDSKIKTVFFEFVFSLLGFHPMHNALCAVRPLNGEDNKVKAEAINDGIVYLMIIPYVLVGAIGYYVYRMKKKKQ